MRSGPFAILAGVLVAGMTPAKSAAQDPAAPVQPAVRRVQLGEVSLSVHPALSPDGRWFVFSRAEDNDHYSLWSVSTAGGVPQRLTSPGYFDYRPHFFPSGDRLVFVSNRPARAGDQSSYAMVMPFDTATGQAAGPARQLSLEPASGVSPSPDGRWVVVHEPADSARLWLVPAEGGRGRLLASYTFVTAGHTWSADGRAIYSTMRKRGSGERIVMRTPIDGGAATEVRRFTGQIGPINGRDGYVIVREEGSGPRGGRLRLVSFDGRVLATLGTDAAMRPSGVSADGRRLYGFESDDVAPIRVAPVAGGPVRQVTPATSYHWAVGWTADGRAVIATGEEGGRPVVRVAPTDGTAGRTLTLPDDGLRPAWQDGATSTHAAYSTTDRSTGRRRLIALSLADGSPTELSSNFLTGGWELEPIGAGGGYGVDGSDFLYLEQSGDTAMLFARTPGRAPRLVRAFPMAIATRSTFAVAGSRVAWAEGAGDSIRVLVAESPTGSPRTVGALRVTRDCCFLVKQWSRDGRHLAVLETASALRIIDVPASGPPAGSRLVETGAEYIYDLHWLPDNGGLTYIAGDGATARVGLVSLRDGNRASIISPQEAGPIWLHMPSPDGRFIAYSDEKVRGAALWMVDLPRLEPARQ